MKLESEVKKLKLEINKYKISIELCKHKGDLLRDGLNDNSCSHSKIISALINHFEDRTYWETSYLKLVKVVFLEVMTFTQDLERWFESSKFYTPKIQERLAPFINEI